MAVLFCRREAAICSCGADSSLLCVSYKKQLSNLESCPLISMQEMGLEPTQPCDYRHLKPARLPFRHSCEHHIKLKALSGNAVSSACPNPVLT